MMYGFFADLVLLLHFTFVLFVGVGGLLVLKHPQLAWLHLPAFCWAVWIEFSGNICPLTPLEQSLLDRAGESSYAGSFIGHYIEPLIYPTALTQEMQWGIGAFVVLLNLLIYLRLCWR